LLQNKRCLLDIRTELRNRNKRRVKQEISAVEGNRIGRVHPEQMLEEVRVALECVERNVEDPCVWTVMDVIEAVATVPPYLFARHPSFRTSALCMMLRFVSTDYDILQDSLEELRKTLEQSLDEEWTEGPLDDEFRSYVTSVLIEDEELHRRLHRRLLDLLQTEA